MIFLWSFLYPEALGLFLLLIVPVLYSKYLKNRNLRLLVSMSFGGNKNKPWVLWINPILQYTALGLLILALARPVQIENRSIHRSIQQSWIVLIDLSSSMESYQTNTHQALEYISTHAEDSEIAWAGFASNCYLILPFTSDYSFLRSQIHTISTRIIDTGKTAVGDALLSCLLFFKTETLHKKILILSDGINNDGKINYNQAIQMLKQRGIESFFIHIGKKNVSFKPDYYFPQDTISIQTQILAAKEKVKTLHQPKQNLIFTDGYMYCIFFALILYLFQWSLTYLGVDNVWKE